MTYQEALAYLGTLGKFGINLGLERIEKLLDLMRRPERRFKTIHVTGTNGKGSTTAMLTAILQAANLRTGMYTSPHLTDYTERFQVNGQQITPEAFAEAIEYTSRFVEKMAADGWEHPTEFEVLTAAAFYYFAAAGVEYAVIEVGLGGLLDSTNVIIPEVAVITNVTLEHTDRCGATVSEIAGHKAGIIKEGVPVVTAAAGEALAAIEAAAAAKKAPLYVLGRDFTATAAGREGWRQQVAISRGGENLGLFTLSLLGRHQVANASLAVIAARVLGEQEGRLTGVAIRDGLAATRWPGRFEVIPGRPTVVIDGAHNPDGAAVLRATLDEVFPGQPVVFLLGILADKDIAGITEALIRPADTVIAARPASERAADPAQVAAGLTAARVEEAGSIADGLARARALAGPDGLVCVAGSLYLIGAARTLASG